MCGIFGVIGANPIGRTIDGLGKLEYRGYDSAGIAFMDGGKIRTIKSVGNIAKLKQKVHADTKRLPAPARSAVQTTSLSHTPAPTVCVGHTRWATNGCVSEENSHPHLSADGTVAAVHNGIIENYGECVSILQGHGIKLRTSVDTEVIPNILYLFYHNNYDILTSVRKTMGILRGDYAVCCMLCKEPDTLITAKSGNMPLHIGIGKDGVFVASDILAFPPECKSRITLQSGEFAVLTKKKVRFFNADGEIKKASAPLLPTDTAIDKDGFSAFMEKEIHDIPSVITRVLDFYRSDTEIRQKITLLKKQIKRCACLHITACGTSYHAGLIIGALVERHLKIRCTVTIASEFSADRILHKNEAALVISQSGETADTISAVHTLQKNGVPVAAICNVGTSTIATEVSVCFPMLCGAEIAVASTKAFVSSVLIGALLVGELSVTETDFTALPDIARNLISGGGILSSAPNDFDKIFFIGKGLDYFLTLESALKVKEVTYMHCEGFPAGELKHGTLSLVDSKTLTVAYFTGDGQTDTKINNAIAEITARGGGVIKLFTGTPRHPAEFITKIIPAQIFALQLSIKLGINPDQPRNLAKSVTVE
jgi:glucosamine--fructose-6-phosphate aminotransferase (isomerizing)